MIHFRPAHTVVAGHRDAIGSIAQDPLAARRTRHLPRDEAPRPAHGLGRISVVSSAIVRSCPQRYRWHLEKNATQMPAISWRRTFSGVPGTSRRAIIELADQLGIPCEEKDMDV